ncbi:MAG: lysophospholipase [Clostridia bacterium]|nr:lysophospholipase [Clostridia bacterium]
MEKIKLFCESPNREDLTAVVWLPDGKPRAFIQILHGMAEHIERYDRTATDLCRYGYAVVGHNHKGHGPETPKEELGYFYEREGWSKLVEDAHAVSDAIRSRYPGVPLVVLGHSMGSFVAREYVIRYGDEIDALVLSGTGWHPAGLCTTAGLLAKCCNRKRPAKLVDRIAFSANNKPFEPARTPFDWLSRDKQEVDKYIQDDYCGFVFTGAAFADMFGGLKELTKLERLEDIPHTLPIYFMSGDKDPVGNMGKSVHEVARQFKQAGVTDVTVHLYDGARHELFNELNRDEVIRDLVSWLNEKIKA